MVLVANTGVAYLDCGMGLVGSLGVDWGWGVWGGGVVIGEL